jgi:YD repeat-containing protein
MLAVLSIANVAVTPAGSVAAPLLNHARAVPPRQVIAVLGRAPMRIAVPEPARRTPPPFPSALRGARAVTSHGVRRSAGIRVPGPPMLRPSDLDFVAAKARERARQALTHRPHAQQQTVVPREIEPARTRGGAPAKAATRTTLSVQAASGTGINPWWRYQEESIPGDGRAMINVGTGNLVLQDDDMNVPHKGIALAFRRTYNSQSLHDVNGDEGGVHTSTPAMYGNGWTNTFDAHLVKVGPGNWSVYDIDGARYDYVENVPGDPSAGYTGHPGQHAILASDGQCGMTWTKKSGTIYYFYRDNPAVGCPALPSIGGYAGRLYQIIGRNRNTSLTFLYSWVNGDASSTGKVSAITVQTESGASATLSFADFAGHQLLQQITYPDGLTSVTYGYDDTGNLTTVTRPANNGAGTKPVQTYGYQALGTGSVLQWAASPRWCASTCGTDGALTAFAYSGTNPAGSTINAISRTAVINPTIPDGSNSTVLQPGYPGGWQLYLTEYYTTGGSNATFRDSDGHATNWVLDSLARPTQTQECTAGANQTCGGTVLVTNETWDSDNNLVSETDPRGNETDYLHDPMGNTTAVGQPYTTTSDGSFKPTQLYDYDQFNNVVAYCDASETHAARADWTPPQASVSTNESLCASQAGSVPYWHATYSYPSYEQYGELASMTTPSGYTRSLSYSASQQAGADYGLPTSITGTPFAQIDGTSITPTQAFWYDANGYLRCYSKGQGASVLSYDQLGRILSVADPDDSSANSSSVCGKSTGLAGWNTQTTYGYFPNGTLQWSQTPPQRTGGVTTSFTYDLDDNPTTETHHYSCISGSSCTPGVTTKWYDGADRLVEVQLPHDPSDFYAPGWLTRYIYDLSGGGSVSFAGTGFRAYGNLFKTQEWVLAPGATSPSWLDLRASAFDGLDRLVTKYGFPPNSSTLRATTNTYDATTGTLGLLTSTTDPLGENTAYTYDNRGHTTNVTFSGDGGVTPNKWFAYDANGREVSATGAAYGTQMTAYDVDGHVKEVDEPASGSLTSPAQIRYDYYPNGEEKAVNVTSSALNAAPLISYAYRTDGALSRTRVGYGRGGDFSFAYTDAGRELTAADPYTGMTMPGPGSPVPPGTAYAPVTSSYGTDGQLTKLVLPQTMAYTIGHDVEGHVATWSAPDSQAGPDFMALQDTVRGENIGESFSSGDGGHATILSQQSANGAMVKAQPHTTGQPDPMYSNVVDPYNAVVASTSHNWYVKNNDPTAYQSPGGTAGAPGSWVYCGRYTSMNIYDAASRLTGRNGALADASSDPSCTDPDGSATSSSTVLYSYDAENHHLTTGVAQPTLTWSPLGHPSKVGANSVHYDGNVPLFVTDADGALLDVKIAALGDVGSSGLLTVWDRDFSGLRQMGHDDSHYDAVWFATSQYRFYGTPPQSINHFFNGSSSTPPPTATASGGLIPYNRLEGFDVGKITIQGARAVDNTSGQWTTPDAYAGDVHDPMSQKAFMWDRSNPYAYSDPNGYFADASNHDPDPGWGTAQWWGGKGQDAEGGTQVAQLDPVSQLIKALFEDILQHEQRRANAGKFTSEDQRDKKYDLHGDDVGAASPEQYENMAVKLFNAALYGRTDKTLAGVWDVGAKGGVAIKIFDGRNLGIYTREGRALNLFPLDGGWKAYKELFGNLPRFPIGAGSVEL